MRSLTRGLPQGEAGLEAKYNDPESRDLAPACQCVCWGAWQLWGRDHQMHLGRSPAQGDDGLDAPAAGTSARVGPEHLWLHNRRARRALSTHHEKGLGSASGVVVDSPQQVITQ